MSGSPVDGGPRALMLFHDAARTVPAYRDFLATHGLDPADVTDVDGLAAVPLSTKDNYVRRYPLPERTRGGDLSAAAHALAVSSGSSGEPTVWPRSTVDELVVARRFESALVDGFGAGTKRTLVVVCFALGNWVGGMYTAAACRHLADKGYPITVATPGNNVDEILRVVRTLGGYFEQTVLAGYPPFVKTVVDAGLPALSMKTLLAGEVFSESWRDLMSARAGMTATDQVSLYGTADAGVLGNETPLSIGIRRFLADNPAAARELFGESRLPTLVQYDPADRYFETAAGTLLFTSDGGVPLVRYHLADEGGLTSYADMLAFCRDHGFSPGSGRPLPFVHVFGRSLFTVSYFGANVYPENVTVALEGPEISAWTTGRFVLQVVSDADENRHLSVVVEQAPESRPNPAVIARDIRATLERLNSEFAHYVPAERRTPVVEMRPVDDPEYFPAGVKHRYTR